MKLDNERVRYIYKYNIAECTDEELISLKKIAIERFAKDERAQLEYAINSLLSDVVDMLVIDGDKGVKNGN